MARRDAFSSTICVNPLARAIPKAARRILAPKKPCPAYAMEYPSQQNDKINSRSSSDLAICKIEYWGQFKMLFQKYANCRARKESQELTAKAWAPIAQSANILE